MAGLGPAIHVFAGGQTWMPATSAGMTVTKDAMRVAYCARGPSARCARAIAASMLVAGPARTARTPVGGADAAALVLQGAMVSMMMLIPANALSISPCTR